MSPPEPPRRRLPDALRVFVTVLREPALRRIQLSFAAFNVVEWASWIAILVYAFERGGALEVGVASLVQLAPSAVIAPVAAALGDRHPRALVLRGAYAVQAVSMLAVAGALAAELPAPVVYAFGALAATSITLTRPAQAALLPELATDPAQLTAANAAMSTIENVGVFAGPALASAILLTAGPGAVFATCGVLMLAVAAAFPRASGDAVPRRGSGGSVVAETLRELAGGLGALRRSAPTRSVVSVLALSQLLLGALDVVYVVLALEVLGLGQAGVGLLNGAVGVGGLVGSLLALALVGRRRMTAWFVLGAIAFGAGIASSGVVTAVAVVVAALALAGAGRSVADVAGWTLLQRVSPSQVLSRVFGVLEGVNMAAQGVGGFLAAGLIAALGVGPALLVAGAVLPLVAIVLGPVLLGFERRTTVPTETIATLRATPLFAALTPPVLERVAAACTSLEVPAGSVVIRQGDPGDRWYLALAGRFAVSVDGQPVHELGRGDGFGEIALLRDVPRTATVTAIEDGRLLSLEREVFLEAVTGQARALREVEAVADAHLAHDRSRRDPGTPA